jgi:uroporphyrinogen-III synthase
VLTLRVAAERHLPLPDGTSVLGGVVRLEAAGPSDRWADQARAAAARVVASRSRARVLVTRPAEGAASVLDTLDVAGFAPVGVATIEVRPEPPGDALDGAIAGAATRGGWLVVTSPNGVRATLAALARRAVQPAAARWGVVGSASAAVLDRTGTTPFVPSRAVGAALAAELPLSPGDEVLLVRGDLADPGVGDALRARGAAVAEVIAYRTHEGPEASRPLLAAALAEPVDALVLASGSAARGLVSLAPAAEMGRLLATPAVCIGPSTASVARSLGFRAVTESHEPGPGALTAAVARALASALPPVPAQDLAEAAGLPAPGAASLAAGLTPPGATLPADPPPVPSPGGTR